MHMIYRLLENTVERLYLMAGLHLYLLLYFCYRHVLNYYYLLVITVGLIYTAFDHTNYRDVQIYLKGFI